MRASVKLPLITQSKWCQAETCEDCRDIKRRSFMGIKRPQWQITTEEDE
jgi:hypothetical protein